MLWLRSGAGFQLLQWRREGVPLGGVCAVGGLCACAPVEIGTTVILHVQTLDLYKGDLGMRSGEAVGAYQRALDLKPNYMRAWANMGISQARPALLTRGPGALRSARLPCKGFAAFVVKQWCALLCFLFGKKKPP